MAKVILHGKLAQALGIPEWDLNVKSPAEALAAIEANTGKLFSFLSSPEQEKAGYRVMIDDKDWTHESQLTLPIKNYKTIHFIPVPQGAGSDNGTWMIIVGVVLIALAVVFTAGAAGGFVAAFGAGGAGFGVGAGIVFSIGLSLTLGGIAQMLAPSAPTIDAGERPDNRPSYLFNGAINTVRQGNPVPVGYGTLIIGSQVISSLRRASDISPVAKYRSSNTYPRGSEVSYKGFYFRASPPEGLAFVSPRNPPILNVTHQTYWTQI